MRNYSLVIAVLVGYALNLGFIQIFVMRYLVLASLL